MSHAHLNLTSPIESQLPQITCFADNKNSQNSLTPLHKLSDFFMFPLFFHCLEEHILPGALFGGTHRTRRGYSLPISNRSLVPVPGEGSSLTAKFESTCVWGEFGLLFAQASYECTQLGWVWLNENLFNSAAWNPGLQVKTLCFDLHS